MLLNNYPPWWADSIATATFCIQIVCLPISHYARTLSWEALGEIINQFLSLLGTEIQLAELTEISALDTVETAWKRPLFTSSHLRSVSVAVNVPLLAVELQEQQVLSFSALCIHNRPSVFRRYKYTQVHTHTQTHTQCLALKNDTNSSIFQATVRGLTETPLLQITLKKR